MSGKSNSFDRRNFLKKSAAGFAAVAAAPAVLTSGNIFTQNKADDENKIVTRKLGKTGLEVPVVSMGVMNADNPALVKAAYEGGMRHFDTAHGYQRGRNEEMVGRVMKQLDRGSCIISTKIPGNDYDIEDGEWDREIDAEEYIEKFHKSLRRLQMDYVDILYLHSAHNKYEVMDEELIPALLKLKEQGKARYIGVSTHRNEHEVIDAVTDSNVYDVVLTAYNFRQDHNNVIGKAIERASKAGIGVVAMKTQAGVYWDEDDEDTRINMKAALKWVLQNPHVHTTIPGFETFDQMNEDLAVLSNIVMTDKEKEDLKLGEDFGFNGTYCNQCELCLGQCGKDVDIPTMMRSYMYAFSYKNLLQAKDTFNEAKVDKLPCSECSVCTVNCAMGFNVREKLVKIDQIRDLPETFLV
jgi:predicted aldo/keto reductase-like oxidoreductase